MAHAIRLVSLMAVLVCLASIGCTQYDEQEKRRFVDIYTYPGMDHATQVNLLRSLAKFYEDYANSLQLSEEQKQRNNELLEDPRR